MFIQLQHSKHSKQSINKIEKIAYKCGLLDSHNRLQSSFSSEIRYFTSHKLEFHALTPAPHCLLRATSSAQNQLKAK